MPDIASLGAGLGSFMGSLASKGGEMLKGGLTASNILPDTAKKKVENIVKGEPGEEEEKQGNPLSSLAGLIAGMGGGNGNNGVGGYVTPNVQATPQGVSFDWQRRNPFAPTSGRK